MEMNTIQINVDTYKRIIKELGVLKTENEELKKRLSTTHNSDYAKSKMDLVRDYLDREQSICIDNLIPQPILVERKITTTNKRGWKNLRTLWNRFIGTYYAIQRLGNFKRQE